MFRSLFRRQPKPEESRASEPEQVPEPVQAPAPKHDDWAAFPRRDEPICPACGAELEKMPGRKKKCPHCGEYMYVRTRYSDDTKLLFTEDELPVAEAIRSVENILSGGWLCDAATVERIRGDLRKKFGAEPSEADVRWGAFNQALVTLSSQRQWEQYKDIRSSMALHLFAQEDFRGSLLTLLEVCYLDINGASDFHDYGEPGIDPIRDFDPKYGGVASDKAERVRQLQERLELSTTELEDEFVSHNERLSESMRLPVSPAKAWPKLKRALGALA